MARNTVMNDGGISPRQIKATFGVIASAVSAAGSTQSDATLIDADLNLITTASAGQGVVLPSFPEGDLLIANGSAVAVLVYPTTGGKINNGSANAAITLYPGLAVECTAINSTDVLAVYVAIPAGSVVTASLADGAVTTAKIADDQVTYAKIQNISAQFRALGRNSASAGDTEEVTLTQLLDWIGSATKGDLLVRDTSAWARLAAGTSGHILTAQGAGALPAYAAPAAGGITTIASGSLPAAATLDITNIPETYAYLVLQLTGVSSNTVTRQPMVQASTNNGVSYDATPANYRGYISSGAAGVGNADTALASLVESALSVGAGEAWDITIVLSGYHTGPYHMFTTFVMNTTSNVRFVNNGVYLGGAGANIDALRVLWSGTGNFDAGTYALYGVS